MNINNLFRKLGQLRREIAQRIKRSPARVTEAASNAAYFIRTGNMKMHDDILRYADSVGVVSAVHPDDLIFRFILKYPGFKTNEEAVKYYFYDGANSAKKLDDLIFSRLNLPRSADISLLEFASGYGCVTRHLVSTLAPINIFSCDIHEPHVHSSSPRLGSRQSCPQPNLRTFALDVIRLISYLPSASFPTCRLILGGVG